MASATLWVLNRHIWLPYWAGRSEDISIVAEREGQHSLRNQVPWSSLPNVQADSLLSLESLSVWGLMSATLDWAWPGSAPHPLKSVASRAVQLSLPLHYNSRQWLRSRKPPSLMCPCGFDHRATGAAWRLRAATYEPFFAYDLMKQSGICPASENTGAHHVHFTTGIAHFRIRCQKKNKVTFGEYILSVMKQNGDCSSYSSIFHLRGLLTRIPLESVAGSESIIKWAHSVCCMFHTYLITGYFSVFFFNLWMSCKLVSWEHSLGNTMLVQTHHFTGYEKWVPKRVAWPA